MDHLNVDRFLTVWAEILSDHYGVDIKFTATRKDTIPEMPGRKE